MIIVMKKSAGKKEVDYVVNKAKKLGFKPHLSVGKERTIIGLIGDERKVQTEQLSAIDGVEKVMPILKPYKLVSREFHPENTVVDVGGVKIGNNQFVIMAGPCAVESEESLIEIAKFVKSKGAKILRGGAFKPRTSPYAFQGLGELGLKYLAKARKVTGLKIVTEVMETSDVELVAKYADILQVGARNMQNFKLLKSVGKIKRPVLLKRGMSATLKEFLMSAEYIMSEGNKDVILCERGIRTFSDFSRNTLDLNIVPKIKQLTHLPIIVDPSHGTGDYTTVIPMSKASIGAGCDGLIIEVHPKPEDAVSDGDQSLTFENFTKLMNEIRPFVKCINKEI